MAYDREQKLEWQRQNRRANHERYLAAQRHYRATPHAQELNRARTAAHAAANPGHRQKLKRIQIYREQYGITLEDYDRMFAAQGGVCAVCGREPPDGRRFAVDHDHVTGRVRSLLCARCNLCVGYLEADIRQAADAYIKRWEVVP